MAKVSVIMPAYNVASYIGESVASVQAQTVSDWELLISNDGSTDETPAIAARLAASDPRIRVIEGPNGGISAARNRALQVAGGEFLAILDSDDLWEPAWLEAQLALFDQHPDVDLITSNGWFLGGRLDGQLARPYPDRRPQPTLAEILRDEQAIFIMSIMRRRVYERVGEFDARLRSNEDYDYWLRAALEGFRFLRNDRPLARYRRRDDSVSASDVRMLNGILFVYAKIRPRLLDRPEELRILDAQVARFERERLAAQAREAMEAGDVRAAADRLAALNARGAGLRIRAASLAARWAPGLFARAYHLRRARQEAAS